MKLNRMLIAVAVCALFAAGCGSSGAGGGSEMPTVEDQATSTAVVGACGGTAASTAGGGIGGLAFEGGADGNVKEGIVNYVARRAIERLQESGGASLEKTASVTQSGNSFIVTFSDESVTNPDGGTATLDGTLNLATTQSGSTVTLTASGDIATVITNWAATATIGGVTYNEVVNGTWTLSFSGTITADGDYSSFTVNLASTITGSNITVTGDATGTATISDFTVTVSGSGTDSSAYTTTCSGSVSITGNAGAETCTVKADCTGCE